MPNWCECELTIKDDEVTLRNIKKLLKGKNGCFDFNKVIPYPKKFKGMDDKARKAEAKQKKGKYVFIKDGYNSGGYEWCIMKWGTKWNACEPVLDDHETGELYYSFSTAWAPPSNVIRKLSKLFPTAKLKMKFFEGGMGFSGIAIFKDGKLKEKLNMNYRGGRGG